jgi:hypothetical protein
MGTRAGLDAVVKRKIPSSSPGTYRDNFTCVLTEIEVHLKFDICISLSASDIQMPTQNFSLFAGNLGVHPLPKETGTFK